jgi:hypothetical protein
VDAYFREHRAEGMARRRLDDRHVVERAPVPCPSPNIGVV